MENLTPNSQAKPKTAWREFLDAFPLVQMVGAGVIGLFATWTTIQLTQNSQAAEIRRNSEKIERLERDQTPRILFDERTQRILDEQIKLNSRLDKLLEDKK